MAKTSLDEILADEKTDLQESIDSEKTKLAVKDSEEEAPQEAEKGEQPEPEEEPESEPPSDDERSEEAGLLAAKQAEKARRKAAEDQSAKLAKELEALRKQFEQSQQKQQEPEQPAPSLWEDDQAWQQHFGGQVVNQATAAAAYQNKLHTSEFYARKNIEGFSDEWENLNAWLQENPSVAQQAASDYDPWGYAYRAYSNKKTMDELGATDVGSLKEQLRQEIMAELQDQTPAQPVVPKSLTGKRSVASRSGPKWSGPKSLDELLG